MIDLLIQAECDFKLVEAIYSDIAEPWAIQAAMYHLQQAIEKLLKTLSILAGNTYPREHNIRRLMAACGDTPLPTALENLADTLSLWEAGVRYDSMVLTSKDKIDQCIELYKQLHAIVLEKTCEPAEAEETELFTSQQGQP